MDTNTLIAIVIVAIVVIIGFIIYRRKAKVGVELPGSKLNFEGSNDPMTSQSTKPRNRSNGIFGNLSIGKTRVEVKGSGAIADNASIGDTELTKEDASPIAQNSHKSKKA